MIPYLGLLPLALGIRAAWRAWRERHHPTDHEPAVATGKGPTVFAVTAVTFANGGDNIPLPGNQIPNPWPTAHERTR